MSIATLIVDDHEDVRFLLRALIDADDELVVSGEAASGEEALICLAETHSEVIVLDEMMPGMSGLDVVRSLRANGSDTRVLLFSAYLDAGTREQAELLGVERLLSKHDVMQVPAIVRELGELVS